MKLVRFGKEWREKPGLIDSQGQIRDLSGLVSDIVGASLSPDNLSRLRGLDVATLPLAPAGQRLGCIRLRTSGPRTSTGTLRLAHRMSPPLSTGAR